jgi:hypothetical protein
MTAAAGPCPARGVRDPTRDENIRRGPRSDPVPANHRGNLTAKHPTTIFVIVGSCFVVLGGLVAGATGPLKLDHGSWLAAYLVLVCDASQCAIGVAQPQLAARPFPERSHWIELICWNVGNAVVVAGTLAAIPILADLGGFSLLVSLVVTIRAVGTSSRPLLGWVYRAAMGILIVSIPIGLTLAHLQSA